MFSELHVYTLRLVCAASRPSSQGKRMTSHSMISRLCCRAPLVRLGTEAHVQSMWEPHPALRKHLALTGEPARGMECMHLLYMGTDKWHHHACCSLATVADSNFMPPCTHACTCLHAVFVSKTVHQLLLAFPPQAPCTRWSVRRPWAGSL